MNETNEKSILLVKPEATRYLGDIGVMLLAGGLRLNQRVRNAQLDMGDTEQLVQFLYPRHCAAFIKAAHDHYWGRPIAWLFVEAPDACERLARLVGECVDPMHCAEGTLRREFGNPDPCLLNDRERGLNFSYYLNGCSCPRSAAEVRRWFASGLFVSNAQAA